MVLELPEMSVTAIAVDHERPVGDSLPEWAGIFRERMERESVGEGNDELHIRQPLSEDAKPWKIADLHRGSKLR
jgi:hypothetical protein